jgi:hypothetical protein
MKIPSNKLAQKSRQQPPKLGRQMASQHSVNPDLAKPPGYERTPTNRAQLNQTQQKDPNLPIKRLEHPARKTARQYSSPLGPHIARAAAFIGSKAMTYLSLIK